MAACRQSQEISPVEYNAIEPEIAISKSNKSGFNTPGAREKLRNSICRKDAPTQPRGQFSSIGAATRSLFFDPNPIPHPNMSSHPLRLLILGDHPDDADTTRRSGGSLSPGGHVVKWSRDERRVRAFSYFGKELADIRESRPDRRRRDRGDRTTSGHPDGRLMPTIEVRERIIRELRTFAPDPSHPSLNDYHPDHRAVGQAVQDASYLVTVPLVCPDVPALCRDPIVGYLPDYSPAGSVRGTS